MSFILASAFPPLPGVDLLNPDTFNTLPSHFQLPEYLARQTNQAFAILSLKPDCILYTSENYADFANIHVTRGTVLSLQDWFNSLFTCSGILIGAHVVPLLESLANAHLGEDHKIVFDFCKQKNGVSGPRVQQQISFLPLMQRNPQILLLCSAQYVKHLSLSYYHEIKLVSNDKVIHRTVLSPPLKKHPILKDLSPTENKILLHLFHNGDPGNDHKELNMAVETLKVHRKHILRKTGFPHIEALLAVLKREMGLQGGHPME